MILKLLLIPFSLFYLLITSIRNFFYDAGWLKQTEVSPTVISVGNLRVGGTGKTPHIEYLINLLKNDFKIAVLSRGYGRVTKGFLLADDRSTANSIGDEPYQIYSKFFPDVKVAVGEDRVLAIPGIIGEHPEINTILLDDAFQHRALARDLNILLTEYSKPFYKDFILPSGRLRESRNGAKRADLIIVTKCPDILTEGDKTILRKKIAEYASDDIPVFFTNIQYQKPAPVFKGSFTGNEKVVLFSGIANPDHLEAEVRKNFRLEKHFVFSDHHRYAPQDIKKIVQHFQGLAGSDKCILTTEKDRTKLLQGGIKEQLKDMPVFYLPIEVRFLENKELFDKTIISTVRKKIERSGD